MPSPASSSSRDRRPGLCASLIRRWIFRTQPNQSRSRDPIKLLDGVANGFFIEGVERGIGRSPVSASASISGIGLGMLPSGSVGIFIVTIVVTIVPPLYIELRGRIFEREK